MPIFWSNHCLLIVLLVTTIRMSSSVAPKNIVVVGGGIQGVSVAFHLSKATPSETKITVLEAKAAASAASGKGGGFMARSWGDGTSTQSLHELAFDMYGTLAAELGCTSYRKLPVLSVSPGYKGGVKAARNDKTLGAMMPTWLDGDVGRISPLGYGDDTAQITPKEFVEKMLENSGDKVDVVLGTCTGVETEEGSAPGSCKVVGVKYVPRNLGGEGEGHDQVEEILTADAMVVSAGPWSCAAEDWFQGAVELPMEGVKSTSIVWKKPEEFDVDATALFCGEDDRFGTHLEVYPRPDGTIYICGIGGSDYVTREELKEGAFRDECNPNESRVKAASSSFQEMSSVYKKVGTLDRTAACMRPCPPDAKPYMGTIPGYSNAYINAGHNCWVCIAFLSSISSSILCLYI